MLTLMGDVAIMRRCLFFDNRAGIARPYAEDGRVGATIGRP